MDWICSVGHWEFWSLGLCTTTNHRFCTVFGKMRLDLPQKGRSGFLTDFGMVQDSQKQIKSSNANHRVGWSCQAWTTLGNSVGAHSWGRRPYRWWPQTKWDSWVVTRLSLNRRSFASLLVVKRNYNENGGPSSSKKCIRFQEASPAATLKDFVKQALISLLPPHLHFWNAVYPKWIGVGQATPQAHHCWFSALEAYRNSYNWTMRERLDLMWSETKWLAVCRRFCLHWSFASAVWRDWLHNPFKSDSDKWAPAP